MHRADRADQRVRVHVLVEHARRAGPQRRAGRAGLGGAGQHEHAGGAAAGLQLAEHGDAVQPGSLRSSRITSGRELGGQRERGGAVAGLAGHLDPVLHLEQHAQALPDHRVVIDDQDGDRAASSASPLAGTGHPHHRCPRAGPDGQLCRPPRPRARRIERAQPPDARRGRLPAPGHAHEPAPVVGLPRGRPGAPSGTAAGRPAAAGVPQRVVQRLLGDPVQRRLGAGRRARAGQPAVNVTGTPCARPASTAYRRRDSASPPASRSGGARPSMIARSSAWASRGRARRRRRSRPAPGRRPPAPGRQDRGGPGVRPDAEQLLRDRVVQFPGQPGALLQHGQLAAALVQPGVGQRDRGVRGEQGAGSPRPVR